MFALDSCLATKITSFTIFFVKCKAFHYLPFVNTGWQLHYLYAKPDMWMLYIKMWGHTYILTFTWKAWLLLCSAATVNFTCSTMCCCIKAGCIMFLPEKLHWPFVKQWTSSACSSWIPTFPFLPLELVIGVTNHSLVIEVWLCSLETSSWRLSQISSCGMWSYGLRSTPWKNWLQTEMSQIQILSHTPERKASHHAGVGDRLGTLRIPGK